MSYKLVQIILSILIIPTFVFAGTTPVHQERGVVENEIVLTGFNLTIEEIVAFSQKKGKIRLDTAAWKRACSSHELLLNAAKEGKAVYGLNRGVGLNKDKSIFEGDALS